MSIESGPAGLNVQLLEQARAILARLDDATYARASALNPEGSIGRHLRHCLDFYRCFLDGLKLDRIDYTHRERDGEVEERREAAADRIGEILRGLQTIEVGGHRPILVRDEEHPGAMAAAGWSRSSVARELQFLASHTLHHLALTAMLLRFFGVEPGAAFGVAPSTLLYREENEQCVRP
jgi:uncharacterized damage-inducible protein DinB